MLEPNNAGAYNNRGISKSNLKDYNGAISDFNKAIELDPDYASAYNNRGSTKDDLKDAGKTKDQYNILFKLISKD